ncbi:MAG: insulinase family protein [Bacteroidales bacterium]|nr:insulinase family protein [Bacteroidales bacterium]
MIDIDTTNLVPQERLLANGNPLYCFYSDAVELVKVDFSFEAGSCYQPKLLVAAATASLIGEGTARHSATEIAEFMDFRGIVIERNPDVTTPTITFYTLKKFLSELIPWMHEILTQSVFPQEEFDVYVAKHRRQLMAQRLKTSAVAMTAAYEALYGKDHMLGRYALPEDYDRLTVEDVRDFYAQRYHLGGAHIVIAGNYDDEHLEQIDSLFGGYPPMKPDLRSLAVAQPMKGGVQRVPLEGAVQSSIRIGRILPMDWDSEGYAKFLVLTTLLGGYMGSRLMASVREEKGYTYGISAHTHIYRGSIVFFITTDVGVQVTDLAVEEIFRQIELLRTEPVAEEELALVCSVMEGDFIRSIDGIFERSERYRQMYSTGVTERFRERYFEALASIAPADIQALAQRYLDPQELNLTICGN